ncbi:MAG TPA: hypothetical protein DD723_08640 [Candidatus Omnitrophica bacterium]|nr:MAG: hypothetical protein A2Z81_07125 [Omnitrophica WOR_2 bacterium GWA2_45_18]OGX20009.1 MAG: hypothetical protein A2Y04_06170 [Omnitrophica WOR_2 bacterium GWC2_45_7]HBR15585.1 hypothetical protein [Candidatus Omnitrophota bacterium]
MLKKRENRKRILLVDDDGPATLTLNMLLQTRGYAVNVAHSGKEALESISTSTDLILLDLILPDQEGFEICRKLKEDQTTRHIPIIMLSGNIFSKDVIEALYLGADDYLTKPFEYEELVARMEAVMRRASLFQDNLMSCGEEAIICEIRQIIDEELIVPFFQPIFLLNPLKVYALETLCRPKTDSLLSNPELLFKAAIQFGSYEDLEILSWKKALEQAAPHLTDEKLFLNCNPYLIQCQKFQTVKDLFDQSSVKVDNVVLEITERSAITNFKIFYEQLNNYREYGFKFAVDDVGGGYASLESIVTTRPEVIKIDRHIVSDLGNDNLKISIVKFIVAFCKENKIFSIAEGIESKSDLEIIKGLGVDAAQGYYLHKPTSRIDFEEMIKYARI